MTPASLVRVQLPQPYGGVSELVDDADLKSVGGSTVRVRSPSPLPYLGVRQLVDGVIWDHEAVGSSPTTQTNKDQGEILGLFYILR